MNSWPFLALLGSLIFLVLFIAGWQMREHLNNLSRIKFPSQSSLYADPDPEFVTGRNAYMRPER